MLLYLQFDWMRYFVSINCLGNLSILRSALLGVALVLLHRPHVWTCLVSGVRIVSHLGQMLSFWLPLSLAACLLASCLSWQPLLLANLWRATWSTTDQAKMWQLLLLEYIQQLVGYSKAPSDMFRQQWPEWDRRQTNEISKDRLYRVISEQVLTASATCLTVLWTLC